MMSTHKTKNQARCLNCGDVIESKSRHDFVVCSCWDNREGKGIAVDGGNDYHRRVGKTFDWTFRADSI